jgi:NhaA family Na+:H+ antiporter
MPRASRSETFLSAAANLARCAGAPAWEASLSTERIYTSVCSNDTRSGRSEHTTMTRPSAARDQREKLPFVHSIVRPFQEFARTEAAGGIVLLLCAVIALFWANSPWSDSYFRLWEQSLSVGIGRFVLVRSLHQWINDGLMSVFFFVVGLEIKRELLLGELASLRRAALPIAAAIGGMIAPALIFLAFNPSGPARAGWAIPVATDIAFALGALALIAARASGGLKVFLAALAIVDDIGAVVVIAAFYTATLAPQHLFAAAVVLFALVSCNVAGVRRPIVYGVLGLILWIDILASGVHATVAGVLLAVTIPARAKINEEEFVARAKTAVEAFAHASRMAISDHEQEDKALQLLERSVRAAQSPLVRLEHGLTGLVAFGIVPLFALANAGVHIRGDLFATLSYHVLAGVFFGLVIGKFVGISTASWLAVRTGVAAAPADLNWRALRGLSWLGGIGFTMSLFIATLAYASGPLLDSAKLGILCGSATAGFIGWTQLRTAVPAVQTEAFEASPGQSLESSA